MSHSPENTERMRKMRRSRRRKGLCAQCGARRSAFYRCGVCRPGHNDEQRNRMADERAEARS